MRSLSNHPISENPIRFGWARAGHQAIDCGAIAKLGGNPFWQGYLGQNFAQLEAANAAQDIYYQGPASYANLEAADNTQPGAPATPQTWHWVKQNFTPQAAQAIQSRWQFQPLQPWHLPAGPNLFHSINGAYQQTVTVLRQLRAQVAASSSGAPVDQALNGQLNTQLNGLIGNLNHYVGDLFMPLHASTFFNWPIYPAPNAHPINPALSKMIHEVLEVETLGPQDYERLVHAAGSPYMGNQPLAQLNSQTLPGFILRNLQDTHLALFHLVDIQRNLEANPALAANPLQFEQALKEAAKPLLYQQIGKAQWALASVLQSAFQEAEHAPL